ncbi:MAG: TIGR03617 family F420-dependent LLM class oxidoreductase [Pseudomonadales bacterium]|jgi:probable F420-dependent oxidoreductase|nr:TIGR03617 family F420-dependent LLM class oxidoreductase [Pseudomonadales bacterium]
MKFDFCLLNNAPDEIKKFACELESAGFNGIYTFEGQHDPFIPLAFAAASTKNIDLMTAVAIAFGRSPLTIAHTAYDLNFISEGRFTLGLGSQVKAHIERRYSMPWSHPAARMKEYVSALRSIWNCWQYGADLNFKGNFYEHTLMSPTFNPGPTNFGIPKIFLGGVGDSMVRVAGEVGDGHIIHPFHTKEYLLTHTLPTLKSLLQNA